MHYISKSQLVAVPMTSNFAMKLDLIPTQQLAALMNNNQDGYQVTDEDGTVHWVETSVFKSTHVAVDTEFFDVGEAIRLAKLGKKVARRNMLEYGIYLYYVPANKYPASRNENDTMIGEYKDDLVPYSAYMAIKLANGTVSPWVCPTIDLLAEDYCLVP